MSLQGKKNIYTCQQCRGHIVTVDKDAGTTPFMIGCRATKGCRGIMQSSFYRVFDQKMAAEYEWYRPDAAEAATLDPGTRHHVEMGGLLIRKIGGEVVKHHTKEMKCLKCGQRLNACTAVLQEVAPSPGDFSLCIGCGHVMAFADDLSLRELSEKEASYAAEDPDVLRAQAAIRNMQQAKQERERRLN